MLKNLEDGIKIEIVLGAVRLLLHRCDGLNGRRRGGGLGLLFLLLAKFDTVLLKQDAYKVVLPKGHPLAEKEAVAVQDLNGLPFLLLERGGKTEVSDLLERAHVQPDIRLPHGRILPSWRWWKREWASASCRS